MADRRQRSDGKKGTNRRRQDVQSSGKARNRQNVSERTESRRTASKRDNVRKVSGKKNRKRRGMSLGKKIALIICIILLLAILAVIAVMASTMSKLGGNKLDPSELDISSELKYDEEGYLNVALFGLDTRENDEEMGTRSDTMMIASLNRKTKEVKLVSVFRDTLLRQEDGTFNKANAAYAYGEEQEAVALLNRNLDLDIQYYVTVDFSAMVDVVDALGGVEINVLQEEIEYINGYSTSIIENTGVESDPVLYAGPQYLNGVQATAYARIRQVGNNDFQRAERQRTVLLEIAKRAKEANLATLNKIIDRVFPKIRTNFTLVEILAYAKDIAKYQIGDTVGFPFDLTTQILDVGDSVIPTSLESNVSELHQFFFESENYTPTSTVKEISQEIENLTGTSGSSGADAGAGTGYSDGTDYGYDAGYGSGDYGYDTGYGNDTDYGYDTGYGSGDYGYDTGYGNDTDYGYDMGYDYDTGTDEQVW